MSPSKFPQNELQTAVISSNDPLHVELAKTKVLRSLPSIQGHAMISVGYPIPWADWIDVSPQPMYLEVKLMPARWRWQFRIVIRAVGMLFR